MCKHMLYQCHGYEIMESSQKQCIVYDEKRQKYYMVKKAFAALYIDFESVKEIRIQCIDIIFYLLFAAIPYILYQLFGEILSQKWIREEIYASTILLGITFLMCNLLLHESAHYFMMKCYGRPVKFMRAKTDGRNIKFYLDTTASYLLPKYKRFAVYAVGATVNLYFVYVMLHFAGVSPYTMLFSLLFIILNLIPSKELSNDISSILSMMKR